MSNSIFNFSSASLVISCVSLKSSLENKITMNIFKRKYNLSKKGDILYLTTSTRDKDVYELSKNPDIRTYINLKRSFFNYYNSLSLIYVSSSIDKMLNKEYFNLLLEFDNIIEDQVQPLILNLNYDLNCDIQYFDTDHFNQRMWQVIL